MIIHHICLVLITAPTNRRIHKLILLNDTWHINWGLKVVTGKSFYHDHNDRMREKWRDRHSFSLWRFSVTQVTVFRTRFLRQLDWFSSSELRKPSGEKAKRLQEKKQLIKSSWRRNLFVVQDRWIYQNFIVCSMLTMFTRYTRLRSFL